MLIHTLQTKDVGGGGAAAFTLLTCPRPWPALVPSASSCSSAPPSIAEHSQLLLDASAGNGRTWRWPGRLGTWWRAAGGGQIGAAVPGAEVRRAERSAAGREEVRRVGPACGGSAHSMWMRNNGTTEGSDQLEIGIVE
jgi:hypothetical protein